MKNKLLLLFAFVLTNFSFSQEEILGEWFLHEIVDLDVPISYENYPNTNIIFEQNDDDGYSFHGNSPCNSYFQDIISITDNYFESYIPNWTLAMCPNEQDISFEDLMKNSLYYNQNEGNDVIQYEYEIYETGDDAILYIYNTYYSEDWETNMGYLMIFGSQPLVTIEGQWFLDHIVVNSEIRYSTIPNSQDDIIFHENGTYNGSTCSNGFTGEYDTSGDNFILNLVALTGFCDHAFESDYFLLPYLYDVLSPSDDNDEFLSSYYVINGMGDQSILEITREDGNKAIYKKTPSEPIDLPGVWYINQITYNDQVFYNNFNENSFIEFTLDDDLDFGLAVNGEGICNSFDGAYYLTNNTDSFAMENYNSLETVDCVSDEQNQFEAYLFDILSVDNDGLVLYDDYQFEISTQDDFQELIITKLNGNSTSGKVTYDNDVLYNIVLSSQPLSKNEFHQNLPISIHQNPVVDVIYLKNLRNNNIELKELSYTIYSFDGKKIYSDQLNSDQINVEYLSQGIYFLQLFTVDGRKTIKFIKK